MCHPLTRRSRCRIVRRTPMRRRSPHAWWVLPLLSACLPEGPSPRGAHIVADHWVVAVCWGPGAPPDIAVLGRASPRPTDDEALQTSAVWLPEGTEVRLPAVVRWEFFGNSWTHTAGDGFARFWDARGRLCDVEGATGPIQGSDHDLAYVCADPRTGAREDLVRTNGDAALADGGRALVWTDPQGHTFARWGDAGPVALGSNVWTVPDAVYDIDRTREPNVLRRWVNGTSTDVSTDVSSFRLFRNDGDEWLLVTHEHRVSALRDVEYLNPRTGARYPAAHGVSSAVLSDDQRWIAAQADTSVQMIDLAGERSVVIAMPSCDADDSCPGGLGGVGLELGFPPHSATLWLRWQYQRLHLWAHDELVATHVAPAGFAFDDSWSPSGRWAIMRPTAATGATFLAAVDDLEQPRLSLSTDDSYRVFDETPDGSLLLRVRVGETSRDDLLWVDPATGARRTLLERVAAARSSGGRVLALARTEGQPPIGDLVLVDTRGAGDGVQVIASNVLAYDVAAACPSCGLLASGARVVYAVRSRVESTHDGVWVAELP